MYDPPPLRKRKVQMAGWSVQMYTTFVGGWVSLGQDGTKIE